MSDAYENLVKVIQKYNQKFDVDLLNKTYKFAKSAHEGQTRVTGEPYIIHPVLVATTLAELELDSVCIIAGLLHDVVEDTPVTLEMINEQFGKEVSEIVDGVTKLARIPYTTKEEQQAENIRKMFFAMSKDIRVILIKLADRLHNMRTLESMPEEHRIEKAKETLEIYAPLANRLGIFKLQSELEDLSLKYLEPDNYKRLLEELSAKWDEREASIAGISANIKHKLDEIGIEAHIEHRLKHLYSIHKKMKANAKPLSEIYDIFALRIIVHHVNECYTALGKVHEEYKPIPGRFKDYIAMPKLNMYQSLHTTLIGDNGAPFEVQIRTWEMHRIAEAGIAAHWRYKLENPAKDDAFSKNARGGGGKTDTLDENDLKLAWLRQLMEWQKDLRDAGDFVDSLKMDLFTDEVFVFSPKGDVFDLPNGSTPVDFAYNIHSAIGNKMGGARVNGKIVPLGYQLQNGDIVEIITSSSIQGPSRDWLKIVKSSQAKNKINQWFKRENREENVVRGKELVERELKKQGYPYSQLFKAEWVDLLLKRYSFQSLDDVYSAVGYGGITANRIVSRLVDEYRKANKIEQFIEIAQEGNDVQKQSTKKANLPQSGIVVMGLENCLVRLSRCCNPVPGDQIIGYVTRARGVSVHRADCINAVENIDDSNRLIQVSWNTDLKDSYLADITIIARDRAGLMMDISSIAMAADISMQGINAKISKNEFAIISLTLEINDTKQLDNIIRKIMGVKSIINVTRAKQG